MQNKKRQFKIKKPILFDLMKRERSAGIAALLAIVIIGAVALIMTYSSSMLGLGELDSGYTSQRGTDAFFITDSCFEEALRRIRSNAGYGIGAGTIIMPVLNGSCAITITDLGGGNRLVDMIGTGAEYNKHIQAEIALGATITINKWEERDD